MPNSQLVNPSGYKVLCRIINGRILKWRYLSTFSTIFQTIFSGDIPLGLKNRPYPLVNIQKAIENGPVEIVDLPIKNGDFP